MKSTREVTEITGINRRILVDYKERNIIVPTYVQDNKYCFYDDEAITKVFLAQIFRSVDYSREKIKKLLNEPELDLLGEYGKVIEILEQKKKEYEARIRYMKFIYALEELKFPATTEKALVHLVQEMFSSGLSMGETWKDFLQYSDEEIADMQEELPFIMHFFAVTALHTEDPQGRNVQQCIHNLYSCFLSMDKNENITEEQIFNSDNIDMYSEFVQYLLSDVCLDELKFLDKDKKNFLKVAFDYYFNTTFNRLCLRKKNEKVNK